MPKKIKFIFLVLIIFFLFIPFNFNNSKFLKTKSIVLADEFNTYPYAEFPGGIAIIGDVTWTKDTPNLDFNKPIIIVEGATLTIEKGTIVKFEKSLDNNNPSGFFIYDGKLIADGTQSEHIKFTSDQKDSGFLIDFDDQGERTSFLRYVEISKGGHDYAVNSAFHYLKNVLGKIAYAYDNNIDIYHDGYAAVKIEAGKVHIENSFFHNNNFMDVSVWNGQQYDENHKIIGIYKPEVEIVNSNFTDKNALYSDIQCKKEYGEYTDPTCPKRVYLKYNWYNNLLGPTEKNDIIARGVNIYGDYYLNSFRNNDLVVDPVIIIPGIMGSAPSTMISKKLVLDPILHTYDNLIASFEKNGFEENENLFEFPYEWRDSNIQTANLLKEKIQEIKKKTKISKVDLVAHSMGGLVARYYIESPIYQNNVDQLITLGTPNKGAPEAYLEWEAGEGFFTREEKIGKSIFTIEAHELGYKNLKDYIQSRVKSVQELLPDYNYLKENSTGEMRTYPNNYPANILLDLLNSSKRLDNLKKVTWLNIIGDLSNQKETIKDFKVTESTVSGSWKNGMPKNFYDTTTDQGIEYGIGDGTVPLESSKEVVANKQAILDSTHTDLPTKSQCIVIKDLTGKDACSYVDTFKRITHILTLGVFSPIDIQIISPDGKWIGKNIKNLSESNKIVGAYYTGSDTVNEFATIPNPQEGEYKVITQGTGTGNYRVAIANISEDENNSGQATEVTAEITGTTEEGKIETNQAEITEDKITVKAQDTIPPTLEITSPENKTYLNNQKLKITYTTTDNLTTADKIKTVVTYDDKILTKKEIDLSLEHLEKHNLKITAQDEAKNQTEKEVNFKVTTNLKAIRQNIYHYRKLKLIKNPRVVTILERRITHIQRMEELLQRLEKNWFPQWWKKRIKRYFQLQKDQQIKSLIRIITKNRYLRSNITKSVRVILVEDLKSLLGHRMSK